MATNLIAEIIRLDDCRAQECAINRRGPLAPQHAHVEGLVTCVRCGARVFRHGRLVMAEEAGECPVCCATVVVGPLDLRDPDDIPQIRKRRVKEVQVDEDD